MKALIQRVTSAEVLVAQQSIAKIGAGMLVLVGVETTDTISEANTLAHKLLHFRIFSDDADKMNLNIQQINGDFLLVPQFTLAADTSNGLRPSFSAAAAPDVAKKLFDHLVSVITQSYARISTGQFGADMAVHLCNDGPVTFLLSATAA